ncbi:hypothetical protein A2962_01010 [Candidatus Woesebacteria bacterium RIFCSPLOWO2_01_FULL_39_61]|uniref:Uncharacterized protein n=1 Tax=Candidatus Woesebacteria bacterium RIFCSPHIGHO2_02_FULL_39_13 TaxID=1802505 RepID=A0A1F7YYE7_9BACT|nr:MAG: hypothetical protein A2692_04540 [Candidatus Woesebacteria bacterium RIFCSPHIGHO2_01_FULL_39_95]OGM32297.1 MAG: hypothetical protein A3D01_06580 [Candidatus Woesebacteria bacterium RIFCSPHIGHO2_02_FULL_39_13]OGM37065.1 MAG: hypothetical protein A3E13_00615 [Candidatus Woesebacteria bacterium RIFCSPHIGHO2_12_FULL_40_20]OGM65439.1 MAG: hypothetical protein A2962_01010 [Candidatus Woesebacteria bacterium RIFCSPLOWO2_01_FULL_39_61]OGM75196.1 MAG: hypothetical protein A3H19_06160 [Candidatus
MIVTNFIRALVISFGLAGPLSRLIGLQENNFIMFFFFLDIAFFAILLYLEKKKALFMLNGNE